MLLTLKMHSKYILTPKWMKPLLVIFIFNELYIKIGFKLVSVAESIIVEIDPLKLLFLQKEMLITLEIHN